MRRMVGVLVTVLGGLPATAAFAQGEPPPLPPPGPQAPPPQPYPQQQYPQQQYPQQQYPQQQYPQGQYQYPPQGQYGSPPPNYGPPPTYYQRPPPPPPEYVEPEPPTHAPKFSLWTGARLGYMGYGFSFYGVQGTSVTTGQLVSPGPMIELDVGARLGRRYVLFGFWEHGFLGAGHAFDGTDASAYSELLGGGFRYTSGDVDSAGFLTEITIGERTVSMSRGGSTFKMQTLEFFKLGLGAEIRLSTLFVLSPLATISTGVMNDGQGSVTFKDGSIGDPSLLNDSRGYVVVSIGMGAHFDVFGK